MTVEEREALILEHLSLIRHVAIVWRRACLRAWRLAIWSTQVSSGFWTL